MRRTNQFTSTLTFTITCVCVSISPEPNVPMLVGMSLHICISIFLKLHSAESIDAIICTAGTWLWKGEDEQRMFVEIDQWIQLELFTIEYQFFDEKNYSPNYHWYTHGYYTQLCSWIVNYYMYLLIVTLKSFDFDFVFSALNFSYKENSSSICNWIHWCCIMWHYQFALVNVHIELYNKNLINKGTILVA